MSEEELKERKVETPGENGDGAAVPSEGEPPETEIRDTDIVFDCPHCGHNLAIDYRGAGLQINCVTCGESVLVPIPDGMKIDDLDIEPGEILEQLFATRRHLQKAEQRMIMPNEQAHDDGEQHRDGCGGDGVGVEHLQQFNVRGLSLIHI